MKIETRKLRDVIAGLVFCSEKKSTIPILSYTQIKGRKGRAVLTATNLDLTYSATLKAEDANGEFYINTRTLDEILKIAGEQVEFVGRNDGFFVRTDQSEWFIDAASGDFPNIIEPPTAFASIPFSAFQRAVKHTQFCVTPDKSRFNLSGAKLSINGKLQMVTTDGHRLAFYSDPSVSTAQEIDALMPASAMKLIGAQKTDNLEIAHAGEYWFIKTENSVLITAKALRGNFPDYQQVLPQNNDRTVKVDSIALARACRAAQIGESHAKRLDLHLIDGVSTIENQRTKFKTHVVTSGDKGGVTILLNPHYLEDVCKVLTGILNISFKNAEAQIEIREPDSAVEYRYILMPLKG